MAPLSLIVSNGGSTINILDKYIIRSDYTDRSINYYVIASENDFSKYSTNSECSIGMCCLAVSLKDNSVQWLLCSKRDLFTWWQLVCDVNTISIAQTNEEEDFAHKDFFETTITIENHPHHLMYIFTNATSK